MPPVSKSSWPKCNACDSAIKTPFDANLHPLLEVIVCRKCYMNYGSGDFSSFTDGVDENGDDNFCRLCVDGGDLYFCGPGQGGNKCHYAFCRDCIRRICPQDEVLTATLEEGFSWTCLACDESKLEHHRKEAQATLIRFSMKGLKRGSNADEVSGSASKKRKTDADTPFVPVIDRRSSKSDSGPSTKDPATPKVPPKAPESSARHLEQARLTKAADTSLPLMKESDSGSTRKPERASMSSSSERPKSSKVVDVNQQREPEATSMPPLEKPRPPKTSLRNLGGPKTSLTPLAKQPPPPPAAATTPTRPPSATTFFIYAYNRPTPTPTQQNKPSTSSTQPTTATVPSQPVKSPTKGNPVIVAQIPAKSNAESQKQRPPGQAAPPAAQAPAPISTVLKSRPNSKQLKVNSEPVVPKIVLSDVELKRRLEHFGNIKDHCIREIHSKFSTILEMFETLETENKSLLKCEIEDIKRPIQEFNNMVANLEGLCHSQI